LKREPNELTPARSPALRLLLRRAAQDPQALEQIVELYKGIVVNTAQRIGPAPGDTLEDVIQAGLVALIQCIGRYDDSRANVFLGYVVRSVWGTLLNARRARFREQAGLCYTDDLPDVEATPGQATAEDPNAFYDLTARLPHDAEADGQFIADDLMELIFVRGLTVEQAARELRQPVEAVQATFCWAKRVLSGR